MTDITGLAHIDLTVSDPVASAKWYCDVLGMEQVHDLLETPTTKIISVVHRPTA
ncbi:MAG: VOC family protein, partial [Acidimicrobiales bacterium]